MRIPWKHLGLSVATLASAALVRWLLDPYLGDHLPYVSFFVAIAVIAYLTTTPVAVASSVAGWFVAEFMFIPPRLSLLIPLDAIDQWVGSAAYFIVAGSIVLIAHRLRRAQQESLLSRRHLELVGNRVPALISYVGPDRRYVWCNDEYTKWFRLPREQIIGREMRDVLGDMAWQSIGPRIAEAFTGRFVEYETESRYTRGGTRWIHATYTPHLDTHGAILGVVAMVTDITERKRMEQNAALLADIGEAFSSRASAEDGARAVTERLVTHLGLSRCLLAQIDEEEQSLSVFHHQAMEPEPSQVGVYPVGDYLTAEERRSLAAGTPLVVNDVREGRDAEAAAGFEALGVRAVVSAPYIIGGRRKFTLVAEKRKTHVWKADEIELLRDISARIFLQLDRARSEQTLRESERRYRSLVSVITDIPCTVDAAGRFVSSQDSWSGYTGQNQDQYRGCGWLDAVHPDDREPARVKWEQARGARTLFEARARIWHADTSEFRHVIARATPVLREDGAVLEWVGACTDIHEETKAAQALLEADRRKDEFLATLAHELRNPLAPIRNALHILRLTGKAEGAVANVQQMLERQVNHMVRLVDDLMEVSRITRGKIELRMEPTDIADVIRSAVETGQPLIDQAGHRLEVSLPSEPLFLQADPIRLAQVVANLLNNAVKYTEPGGRIWLSVRQEESGAVISVRDNGMGIPAPMLPKVFDLFSQVDRRYSRAQGGLGIGLTLARSLVMLHGGSVQARSEGPGHGSEFTVRLPMAASGQGAGARAVRALDDDAVSPRRILVVDDNHDAADSLGVLLTLLGAETRTAHSGFAALEALDEFHPSVILLDLGMPGMDGYEVAERARQHPHGRHVTLVALTGWGQERDRRKSQQAGINHHLVKPVDLDALRQLLATLPPSVGDLATRRA